MDDDRERVPTGRVPQREPTTVEPAALKKLVDTLLNEALERLRRSGMVPGDRRPGRARPSTRDKDSGDR